MRCLGAESPVSAALGEGRKGREGTPRGRGRGPHLHAPAPIHAHKAPPGFRALETQGGDVGPHCAGALARERLA